MINSKNSNKFIKTRIIGLLFISAFLLYGFGRSLFETKLHIQKYFGALLIILNSVAVVFIGVYIRKTLIKINVLIANTYLFSRLIEALALSSIILNLFPNSTISLDFGYFIALLFLGIGSIPMCYTFYKHNLLPKW